MFSLIIVNVNHFFIQTATGHKTNHRSVLIYKQIDHNEDGNMYISPECIAVIKRKQRKEDAKKNTKDIKL